GRDRRLRTALVLAQPAFCAGTGRGAPPASADPRQGLQASVTGASRRFGGAGSQDCQTPMRPLFARDRTVEAWMKSSTILTGVLGLGLLATTPVASLAAVYAPAAQVAPSNPSVLVQHWRPGPRFVGPRYIGPRYWGPRSIGPRAGVVSARPWVRRPY